MKKFLSILLVLCMAVTTLMGVMLADVSAYTTTDKTPASGGFPSADVRMIKDEEGGTTDVIVTLPEEITAQQHFATNAVGDWYIRSHDYTANEDGTTATGSLQNFMSISEESILGRNYYHIDGKATNYTNLPDSYKENNYIVRINPNIIHEYALNGYETTRTGVISGESETVMSPVYPNSQSNYITISDSSLGRGTIDPTLSGTTTVTYEEDGVTVKETTTTVGKVFVKNIYAFSTTKDTDAPVLIVGMNNNTARSSGGDLAGRVKIPAADLYSDSKTPHKISIFVYSDAVDGSVVCAVNGNSATVGGKDYTDDADKTDYIYMAVFIDGMHYATSAKAEWSAGGTAFSWLACTEWYVGEKNGNGNFVVEDDWDYYIHIPESTDNADDNGGVTYANTSRPNSTSITKPYAFQNISRLSGTSNTSGAKGGSIYKSGTANVVAAAEEFDAELESLTSEITLGKDKILTVDETTYNNPASLLLAGSEDKTTSLVNIETGTEVFANDTSSITADETCADYVLRIKGVYVRLALEDAFVFDATTINADGTGAVNYTVNRPLTLEEDITMEILVAACDADGKYIDGKIVPGTIAKDATASGTIAFDATGINTEGAAQYKVFVFETLASAKPLVEMQKADIE